MTMTAADNPKPRSQYMKLKQQFDELAREAAQKDRKIEALKKTIDEIRRRRKVFPDKYMAVIEPILAEWPSVTMDDILRGGGSRGGRNTKDKMAMTALRRRCWRAVYEAFPEDSYVEIAEAFNRSHTCLFHTKKAEGWTR